MTNERVMAELPVSEVMRLVSAANVARWRPDPSVDADNVVAADAERRLDAAFQAHRTLAVYGSLAPGKPNHHVVAPLGGEWTTGEVEGDLYRVGWGAALGYLAFRPRPGGPTVAVHVLTSPALAAAWAELDRFEGPEYRRILVPVFSAGDADGRRLLTVANLYAAAPESHSPEI